MAPERIDNNDYSYESDVWSLGLSIYAAAEAEFPYDIKKGYFSLAKSIVESTAPRLPSSGRYSSSFIDLIDQMLVKDFKKRKRAVQLLKHPFVLDAINKAENFGLPIPR